MSAMWAELRYSVATYPLLYLLWASAVLGWGVAAAMLLTAVLRARPTPLRRAPRRAALRRLARDGLAQVALWRRPLAGAMHLALMAGVLCLLVYFVASHYVAPRGLLWRQWGWVRALHDAGIALLLAGLLTAGYRRHVRREVPAGEGAAALWGVLLVTTLLAWFAHALLIALAEPPWRMQAPLSRGLATLLAVLDRATQRSLYGLVWTLLHALLLGLGLLFPWCRWRHVLLGPLALLSAPTSSPARMIPLNLEGEGPFGARRLCDLTRADRLGLCACMRCGRCTAACPAQQAGRSLDPLQLLMSLAAVDGARPLAERVGEAVLWDCSACLACADACPVGISPLNILLDLRRERVLEAASFPAPLRAAFAGLDRRGNPWGLPREERAAAAQALGLPLLAAGEETEVLLWLGCHGAYEQRARRVAGALLSVLRYAGVECAGLGDLEGCCGDPARRAGHEGLWREASHANAEILRARRWRWLVTLCPHCAHTLAEEYADAGQALGTGRVVHATEFLALLLRQGRLRPPDGDATAAQTLAYHDPCYLARGLGLVAAPRTLLEALPGWRLRELPQARRDALCCGGGGAQMWLDRTGEAPLSAPRAREVIAAGVAACATACPYCAVMLEDALAGHDDAPAVRDVVELWAESLAGGSEPGEAGKGERCRDG